MKPFCLKNPQVTCPTHSLCLVTLAAATPKQEEAVLIQCHPEQLHFTVTRHSMNVAWTRINTSEILHGQTFGHFNKFLWNKCCSTLFHSMLRLLGTQPKRWGHTVQSDTKKTGTFEKPNKNWRNPKKKNYWQKL